MKIIVLPLHLLVLGASVLAQSYDVFDVPGATATYPVSINNSGVVTGYYFEANPFQPRGFVRDRSGNVAVFEGVPAGINDAGVVVGYSYDGAGLRGFLRSHDGTMIRFDVPQPVPNAPAAGFAVAINNAGDIAGYLIPCPICDTYRAFVRDRSGEIATFFVPKGLMATGINARGDVTGHTAPYYYSEDGFIRDRDGTLTMFSVPGARAIGPRAYPVGINNRGDVAGHYHDANFNRMRGFVRDRKGKISVFDAAPNASSTRTAGINEPGDVTGDFDDATGPHNFLRDQRGNITVFDVPNAFTARSRCINNQGDVTGYLFELRDGNLVTRGFVREAH
jgi:hypothetical protein